MQMMQTIAIIVRNWYYLIFLCWILSVKNLNIIVTYIFCLGVSYQKPVDTNFYKLKHYFDIFCEKIIA